MLLQLKSEVFGNIALPFLNRLIHKFLYVAAIQANQVVMMAPFIEFVYRPAIPFAGLKMTAQQKAGLLKLGEYSINRG